MNSHLKIYGPLFKQEGTSRNQRYLPALHPENIMIDDRQLKDLLLYIQKLSGNLLFIGDGEENANGQGPSGRPKSWEDLLKKDPALLMASIAASPVQELRQVYDLLELQSERQRKGSHFMRLVSHVFSVFKKLDEWHSAAAAEEVETRLKKDLQLYIQSYLARKLADLVQISLHTRNLIPGEDIQGISPRTLKNAGKVWGELQEAGSHAVDLAFGERIFIGRDNEEKLTNAASRLKEIFDTVMHVMTQVVNNCNAYLKETLHSKKDHQPHIALLITFLELYGYARDEINKIPQKHLKFYYEQVLGISPRRAVADSVFLSLELEKGFDACELKKGTLFLAGKDKLNKNLFYGVDKDIVVNKARVSAVRTLYLEKDRHRQVLQYYTDPEPGAVGGAGGPAAVAGTKALFGDKAGGVTARAGFAIASEQFRLSGGERNIALRFELAEDIVVGHFDAGIMELRLTGEKGWLSSENIADEFRINSISKVGDKTLELNFTVGINQASAITGCDQRVHGDNFVTALPVLQCLLIYPLLPHDPDAGALNVYQNRIIQLNNLQKIRPVNTFITVGVGHVDVPASFDGVKALEVQNHEAVLDAKKPFYPFTSIPKVGSSFYIGCDEIFAKPIQKLSLNIEWMLPDHFRTYYDKYLPPYDSNRFMASLSFLKKKKWRKINDISIIDVDSVDPRWRTIRIDYSKLKPVAEVPGEETGVARFDATKADGMLKLKLNYPDFGHGIYPQLITSSVMEKASSRQAAPDFFKIVEKQLHDSAISIKMPAGMEDKNGPFKVVVYQVAESNKTDEEAKVMMIKGMSSVIRNFNGSYTRPAGGSPSLQAAQDAEEAGQRVLVNDNNFIERIFGFLRKLKLMDKDTHHDKDKQSIGDTVTGVKEKIESSASSILPADRELVALIIDGTNSAIDQTVVKIVDKIIALRKSGITGSQVAAIVKEEIDEANDVINKMIAGKIASVLLTHEIPAVPYTPVINMISLSYLSSRRCGQDEDQFFRVSPSGVAGMEMGDPLFDDLILRQPAGVLFIGVADSVPGQDLSLLFRLAEGTGTTDKTPPGITWRYLCGNEWRKVPDECLVSDSTYGLQATGILQISVPPDEKQNNSLFGLPGLHWICASVEKDTDAFPCLVDIFANAAVASFRDEGNDPDHAALPLPAGTITRLADKNPAVRKVSQPVASFHGKVMEQAGEYYTRVSERLRHKSRAVNNWDYERLVLENFQEVFKVKCLNDYREGKFARGHVTIVPICDLRNREKDGINMLAPRAGYRLLREIERLLSARSSPFVKVHAVNPLLSKVEIRCRVKFRKDADKGFSLQKLKKELTGYLTPWAGGHEEELSFSTKIYASNVISFIDKREYVDYVQDLEMRQYTEDENAKKIYCRNSSQDISLVETQFIAGHAILISAPVHDIELIN